MTFKTGYCAHCGVDFDYPAHLKRDAKPRFCESHDPDRVAEIDLSEFVDASPLQGPHTEIHIELDPRHHEQAEAEDRLFAEAMRPRFAETIRLIESPQGLGFAGSPRTATINELRSRYQARLDEMQCPEITKIELPMPRHGRIIGINHLGDIHIGTDACAYTAFKEMLNFILHTPDEYLALQGDMVDLLTSQSVGVMAEQALTINEQFRLATADLLPLARAGKILWMLKGNHEDRLDKATKNIVEGALWMAEILDVKYLHTEGYTQVSAGGSSYISYNIHGFNAGGSAGGRRNKMERMLAKFPSADLITCGHNHHLDVIQVTDEYIDPITRTRQPKSRYGLYTGTYHTYMGYAADFGLGQGPLGCGRVEFDVSTGTIHPRRLDVIRTASGYRHQLPN